MKNKMNIPTNKKFQSQYEVVAPSDSATYQYNLEDLSEGFVVYQHKEFGTEFGYDPSKNELDLIIIQEEFQLPANENNLYAMHNKLMDFVKEEFLEDKAEELKIETSVIL